MNNDLYFAKRMVYELYKIDWMRRISAERKMDSIKNYFEETLKDESYVGYPYQDWLEDVGYNGELYVCFYEFCDRELQDREYIRWLIGDCKPLMKLIEEYWNAN